MRGLRKPFIYAEKQALLRHALMVVLFAAVCSAFWYSFERTFRAIQADKTYFDETKTTTEEDMERYGRLTACLNRSWDIKTLVHIRNGAVYIPSIQKNTLFIGVSAMPGQTVVILPPLVRKTFPKETVQAIETELDRCAQKSRNLPFCALNALDKIHMLLGEPEMESYK